jgi:hypothetical protein
VTCPVCKRPSALNSILGDPRCGPCYNFRITAIDGYAAILRVDFDNWLREQETRIRQANNLETYRDWLDALRARRAP